MSWVTVVWTMLMGGCVAIALPFLLTAIWQRRAVNLFFSAAVGAIFAMAVMELAMMRANSIEQFARAQQWAHVPLFVLVVALVGFVYFYFGTSRLWLGVAACFVRFICLIINFAFPPNLNFREITALRPVPFLGETVSTPVGVVNPWTHLGELSSLLVLVFVVDASIRLWREGRARDRRLALVVGGSITFFIVVAAGWGALIHLQVIQAPYFVSFPFAAVIAAMSFELSYNMFRATQVARKLRLSQSSLRESESRFEALADAAPVMLWMSGTDKLCTFFNKAWLSFSGRTMAQEMGNGWAEGVHRDDFEKTLETYTVAFDARESFKMQYRLRRHDGEYRWLTDHGVPRYDDQGNFAGYIGSCVDITDVLSKDEALHRFEERVALAADAAHLGVWELDTTTNKIWMSDKARALFQFEPRERMTYEIFQGRVHPQDRAAREAALKRAIETQGGYEIEYRAVLPGGTVRWIAGRARCVSDDGGRLVRLLGVSMDVTERKQAQELFRLATEAAPSGILLVNDQGRIVLVNAHIQELFGYERDELIGKTIETLLPGRFGSVHVDLRTEFLAAPRRQMLGRGRELFGCRKDGSEFPVEIGLNPVQTPQGSLVLATVVDISARKLAEEEAHRRRDEMTHLSRVSLVGEMTATIAHELNQPLAGIMSNASAGQRFIDRGDVDPGKLHEILVDIVDDGRRASGIIRSIRNTLKKGAAVRQRIDLNEIVMNVAHMVQPDALAHSCELKTSLAPDLPALEGDPIQIQQVLINLIGNAFDAMRETPVSHRQVEITSVRDGEGAIRVSVRDHGGGIAPEVRERLFEQFFTTKEEGLGMGLAIVRSAIEAHAGSIGVDNAEGGGARFYFTLPVSK